MGALILDTGFLKLDLIAFIKDSSQRVIAASVSVSLILHPSAPPNTLLNPDSQATGSSSVEQHQIQWTICDVRLGCLLFCRLTAVKQ